MGYWRAHDFSPARWIGLARGAQHHGGVAATLDRDGVATLEQADETLDVVGRERSPDGTIRERSVAEHELETVAEVEL